MTKEQSVNDDRITNDLRQMVDRSDAESSRKTVASSLIRGYEDATNDDRDGAIQIIKLMFPMIFEIYLNQEQAIKKAITEHANSCVKMGKTGVILKAIGWPGVLVVIILRLNHILDAIFGVIK
jgi:hypothetical protein